jgi:hypothetical protein
LLPLQLFIRLRLRLPPHIAGESIIIYDYELRLLRMGLLLSKPISGIEGRDRRTYDIGAS